MQRHDFKSALRFALVCGLALTLSLALFACDGGDDNDANPATANDLQNRQFIFNDGAALGFENDLVAIRYDTFNGNNGTFTLMTPLALGTGNVTLGSCNHTVTESNNATKLPVGTEINCPTCDIRPDHSLSLACGPANLASTSSPGIDTEPTDNPTDGSGGNPATASALQNQQFVFGDGAARASAFGLS